MTVVNKPQVSKLVASTYLVFALFIAALAALFIYAGFLLAVVLVPVEAVMLLLLASIYRTRHILTDEELVIKATRLIGGEKRISLRAIKSVDRTLIPFGLRLFGASFHGGYYHVPGLGRAFVTITSFKDGVLIETDRSNYIISPKNPEGFRNAVKNRVEASHAI